MEKTIKMATWTYLFDDVTVDSANLRVRKGDNPCKLPPRAFEVLLYLLEHRGRIIEKQELFDKIWKDKFVSDNALTRTIKDIRQTIGDDADAPQYIETIPRRGYRFIAEVKEKQETTSAESFLSPPTIAVPLEKQNLTPAHPTTQSRLPVADKTFGGFKRRSIFLFAAILGLLIVTTAIWLFLRPSQSPETFSVLRTVQITTWTGLDLYPALSPDGNSIAYSSEHNGSFEIYVKPLTPGAREIQLTADGKQNFEPTWSPDGKLVAYYSKDRGGIWVVPATGGTARQLTEFGSHPAWSPDGSLIAFESYALTDLSATSIGALSPSTLWTVPAQGGEPTQITQVGIPSGGHGSASWSPDSKRLVFVAYEGLMPEMWSVAYTGADLKPITRSQRWIYDPIYSPDSKCIYYGGTSAQGNFVLNRICVSPASGEAMGEPVEIANTGLARIKHLTISADGKKLAYSAPMMRGSILSVPVSPTSGEARGVPVSLTQDTSYRKGHPMISPDGRKIAFVEFRGGMNQDIWRMDIDGKNATQVTTHPATDWCPSWFPDSEQIAFQSHRLANPTIWAISTQSGKEKLLVDPHQDIGWPELSPDGKTFVFNSTKNGTVNIWKVAAEGGEPQQLTFDNEQMGWPYWSPDSKFLALQMRRGDDTHICVVPSSGGEVIQLTFDRGQSWTGSWSPDGDKIAFAGYRNGYWNVWWVSRSTKQQKQLTNFTSLNTYVRYPSWSPLRNQIVFEYNETTGNIWLMELK